MMELEVTEKSAERILENDPDPVVRLRILRDVLRRSPDSAELVQARENLSKSRLVRELESERRSDGSWGRFHSMDTRVKQRIVTTGGDVRRAVALGLDASRPVLRKASNYVVGILNGTIEFSDPPEKNRSNNAACGS